MSTERPAPLTNANATPALLQLLAALGTPHVRRELFEKARAVALTDSNGRPFQPNTIGAVLDQAIAAGQVERLHNGFRCTRDYAAVAFKAAVLSGRLARWCTPLLRALHVLGVNEVVLAGYLWQPQALTAARLAAFSGREDLLRQVLQAQLNLRASALAESLHGYVDAELLDELEPGFAVDLATQLLEHGLEAPHITTASVVDWARQCREQDLDAGRLREALVSQLLWRTRFDEAAAVAGTNPALASLVRAHTAAMQGHYLESLPHFEQAAAAMPADAAGKRLPLPVMSAWLQVAAMIAADAPAQLEAADKVSRKWSRDRGARWFWNAMQFVIEARASGSEHQAWFTVGGVRLLDDVTQAIAYAWLRQRPPSHAKPLIEGWARTCEATGYLWIGRELRACLALWDKCPATPGLASVFYQQPPWQRALKAITGLQGRSQESAEDTETRIAWRVQPDESGVVQVIEPWEQKRGKRGWNRGKRIGLGTLLRDETLQPMDARVVSAARATTTGSCELDTHRAARALLGHPLVFFDEDLTNPVELTAAEPELRVTSHEIDGAPWTRLVLQPSAKQILAAFERATISIGGKLPSDPCLVCRHAVHSAQVILLGAAHKRLAQHIGDALDIPADGAKELEAALTAAAQHCIVHIAGDAATNETPTAEGTLRAELSPRGSGLRLQLVMRPFGTGGPRYAPGRGGARVFAKIEGQARSVLRDLAQERAAADDVMAVLTSVAIDGDTLQADCEQPSTCLELLEQLQSLHHLLQIDWPAGIKYRLSRSYTAADVKVSLARRKDWFTLDGGLTLDDGRVLELRQLLDAARRGHGRFVPLGDDGFVALSDHLAQRLNELTLLDEAKSGEAKLPLAAALALADITDGMQVESSAPWQHAMQRITAALALSPEPPSTLQAQLRPYQLEGFRWLARLAHWGGGACLADDMGLGKTLQALAVLLLRAPDGPALVVAPTSVCQNWLDEARRFAPALRVQWFVGAERASLLDAVGPFDVLVCSYTLLQQDIERFSAQPWHSVVLDEAQAVKNVTTKRAQAVLALQADFRLAVTGTPVENRLEELWMVFRFLNPGLLGTRERFAERFVAPIERANDSGVRAHLRHLIAPFILRRTKSAVLTELPPRTEITLSVEPEAEEAAFHEALRQQALEALADPATPAQQKRFRILAELMRVRRACCHPQLLAPETDVGSAKLKAFLELVAELVANRHKALVFSQFVDHLSLLRRELDTAGISYQYLDGSTPAAERAQRVQAFQSGSGDLFLISLRAGGVGLNLTAADYVIITDPWWNPAVEDQAASRAHRMGQTRPVTVYRLVVKGSIEERIMQLHGEKRALAEGLFTGEEFGGAWSVEDLMQLLRGG